MFQKILRFWRSLSPASMPRALWVIMHHLRLPAVQEEQWEPLLDTVRELLLFQPLATTEMHTQARARICCRCESVGRPSCAHICMCCYLSKHSRLPASVTITCLSASSC